MHALLVLVQISDGEEGLGEVNVVQVEVFQDPPDQAMLNDLPNLMEKCWTVAADILDTVRAWPQPCSIYRYWISIVDITTLLKSIDIDINIDKEILENIDININIDKEILENINIDIDIDKNIRKY